MIRYYVHSQSSAGLLLNATVRTGMHETLEMNFSMSPDPGLVLVRHPAHGALPHPAKVVVLQDL